MVRPELLNLIEQALTVQSEPFVHVQPLGDLGDAEQLRLRYLPLQAGLLYRIEKNSHNVHCTGAAVDHILLVPYICKSKPGRQCCGSGSFFGN